MAKEYKQITRDLSRALIEIRRGIPDVYKGFTALAEAATKNSVLDRKTKELIAIAIAVTVRCDGCIGFHTNTLLDLQASREELLDALGMAIYMGGGPSLMYAAETLAAYDELARE